MPGTAAQPPCSSTRQTRQTRRAARQRHDSGYGVAESATSTAQSGQSTISTCPCPSARSLAGLGVGWTVALCRRHLSQLTSTCLFQLHQPHLRLHWLSRLKGSSCQ
jgi:hypothetical protein